MQRVAIARSIVCKPRSLVADEPVSMLDVSIRAGVLNLFKRFRTELDMSIIYVSHDLATIRYICDRTAILCLGRFAELGPTEEVMERPRHPYTQLLLSAVPRANPNEERRKVDARGEIPSPINIPNGCRFHARCPYVLAHCGWEGANLARMIRAQLIDDDLRKISSEEAFRVDETGGPSRPLESVQIEPLREIKLHNHGTDLHVTGFRCDAAVVVEALEAVISASLTSIGEAVLGIETTAVKEDVA